MNIFKSIIKVFKTLTTNAGTEKRRDRFTAKQIQLEELAEELNRVLEGKTDFNFIGITANGYDSLFFVRNDQNFNLEFRALKKIQLPYLEPLEEFASKHNIKFETEKLDRIPYLSLETNTNITETVDLAKRIQKEVFGNNDSTVYKVIP
ncbi:hypothetical protein Q73A0000_01835 [Kaistella flava (ex Peng et al. 2021)]|uniref:Uncharacterized protein n=1 Tax=Kaistella flava (ex Peng et al. 2021) TaxID=2038776 RepID=A0A7M2Y6X8_9FLAO|nr:hypothetical protein [Kaistella flava (ex Peng et al. 2021)]QOW09182.1 hypothetical protein Q73A0000_01835 [Kaistella flava (ex Peng et al. 2021)]